MLKEKINSIAIDSGQLTRPKITEITEVHAKIMKNHLKRMLEM